MGLFCFALLFFPFSLLPFPFPFSLPSSLPSFCSSSLPPSLPFFLFISLHFFLSFPPSPFFPSTKLKKIPLLSGMRKRPYNLYFLTHFKTKTWVISEISSRVLHRGFSRHCCGTKKGSCERDFYLTGHWLNEAISSGFTKTVGDLLCIFRDVSRSLLYYHARTSNNSFHEAHKETNCITVISRSYPCKWGKRFVAPIEKGI